jgi:multiple sugar transport system permease protein
MSHTDVIGQPGTSPTGNSQGESWGEWLDRHSSTFFIAPAVTFILIFAIFPTFYSIVFALSRVRFTADGLQFRFVWFQNFAKQFLGNDQQHFLGKIGTMGVFGTVFLVAVTAAVLWWLYRSVKITSWVGMLGRIISAAMAIFIAWVMAASLLSGNSIGTLLTTLFYVFIGCALQFVIGTGLAFLCSQPIAGKNFFRVIFFIPLMITPLGVGYAMKMVADITKGPFQPLFGAAAVDTWVWSADPWASRFVMMICDSWQWIPFIFIRMIEAFKIVDLPNIMTGGGPGSSTESMTLHSMYIWRANDVGTSAAVAYLLLIITVVVCASFFNYVVLGQLRKAHT